LPAKGRVSAAARQQHKAAIRRVLKKRGIMGKSQETQQLAVGMSRKCGFGSYRPHYGFLLPDSANDGIIIEQPTPKTQPTSGTVILRRKSKIGQSAANVLLACLLRL
jgi:hypothetical protein